MNIRGRDGCVILTFVSVKWCLSRPIARRGLDGVTVAPSELCRPQPAPGGRGDCAGE